ILLVDDDVLIAESNKFILKKAGYNIAGIATEGLQAIKLAKEKQPDLILMDVNLGNSMDGITAAEEIQKFADIPFIFLTAYSDNATIERAKKVGPFGYLIKPFDNRELVVAIETSLYKHSFDKKIKEQELLFRTVANFAYEWEFWLQPDLQFKYCSPSCQRLTGYKPEDFTSNPKLLFDIVHPDDKDAFEKHIQNSYNEKKDEIVADFQFRIIDKYGIVKFVSHTCSSIFDDKKNYLGRRGTNVDITQRKLTELVLLESEERNRAITETANDSIITIDTYGKILSWNKSSEKIFGYETLEMVGRDLFAIIPDKHKADHQKTFGHLIKGGVAKLIGQTVELTGLRKNGSEFPIEISLSSWESNSQKYYTAIIRDITERKLAEEQIKEANLGLQLAIEGGELGTFDADITNGKVKVNDRYLTMLGYSPGAIEMTKEFWMNLIHHEDLPGVLDLSNKIESGEIREMEIEYRIKHKSGNWIWIFDKAKGFNYDNKGKPTRSAGTHRDITSSKQAEEALIKSEERYRHISAAVSDYVFSSQVDKSGKLILNWVAGAFEKITGYTFEEYTSCGGWRARIHPEDIGVDDRDMEKLRSNQPVITELRTLKKDGSVLWVGVYANPVMSSDGKELIGINGAVRDITERKLAEEVIQKNKERWQSLFNNSPNAIAVYQVVDDGNDFLFTDFNLTAQTTENLTRDEVIGKRISQLFPGAEGLGFLDIFRKVWQTGKTEYIKSSFYKDNRIEGWRENIIYKLNTGEIVAIYNDVTERMEAEIALRTSEEKFRSIFENHSAIKLLIDPDTGNIVDANQAAANYYGWTREELKQMNITRLNSLSLEDAINVMEQIKVNSKNHFELQHRLKDGSIRDMEVFSSKVEIGGKIYLHAINHDITDRIIAEKKLKEYQNHLEELVETRTEELDKLNVDLKEQLQKEKELEMMLRKSLGKEKELNELKTRFISTASHEFRTPLTTVLAATEMIQRYGKKWSEEKYNEYIDKIKKSVSYLTKLMDDVLTISRSESGKILYNPDMVNLYKLCTEIIEETRSNTDARHDFVFNFSMRKIKYHLDPNLIKFILTNLLSNAFKYSPEGGKIELSVSSKKDQIEITVADEGIGIPGEDMIHLFEPFHRSANTVEIPGTGLGLSIVKHAVELHKGKITVKSSLGKGTTFTVDIPKRKK
ncbi:MAG: PAS domain S-box protein, partial [Melioribacteraceae bacterium]